MRLWHRWVDLRSHEEHAGVLALLRIALAAVLLADVLSIIGLGLVGPLYGPEHLGALSNASVRDHPPMVYRVLGPSMHTAWFIVGAAVMTTFSLMVGFFTRT